MRRIPRTGEVWSALAAGWWGPVVAGTLWAGGFATGAIAASALLVVVLAALALALDVELPRGGTVPLGHAVVVALAVLLEPLAFAVVAFAAVALGVPVQLHRRGTASARAHLVGLAAAAAVAVAVAPTAVRLLAVAGLEDSVATVIAVGVVGVPYLAADLAARGRTAPGPHASGSWTMALALLCAAALLAVAYEVDGPATAAIAAVPLLVIRFSFERYSAARRTYEQTVEALSILPEIAGLTALGHGRRSAVVAAALAERLELPPAAVERVATAAAVHHLGALADDTAADPQRSAAAGAELLRGTGFLDDVAEVVAGLAPGPGAPPDGNGRLLAATVHAACAYDKAVATGAPPEVAAHAARAAEDDAAVTTACAALSALLVDDPGLTDRAAATVAPLLEAAERGHEGDEDHDHEEATPT